MTYSIIKSLVNWSTNKFKNKNKYILILYDSKIKSNILFYAEILSKKYEVYILDINNKDVINHNKDFEYTTTPTIKFFEGEKLYKILTDMHYNKLTEICYNWK